MESQTADSGEVPSTNPTVPLNRNRNFRRLWVGQVLSDLGTGVGGLAYPLLVFQLTHSAVTAGAVGTVAAVGAFIVRLPAGALADRHDRRRIMVTCDVVRMAVLGLLAVGVFEHWVAWPVVMAVAVVDRMGDTLFSPASMAALPHIVAEDQLEQAWAATEARQYVANLGGPTLGGLLYGVAAAVPFVGDAVSYGVSALTSATLSGDFSTKPADGDRPGLWRESFEGIRVIRRDPLLRAVIVQAPLINLAFNGVIMAIILGMRVGGKTSTQIGLTESLMMVGGLLGAVVATRVQGKLTLQGMVVALTLGGTCLMGVAAVLMPSPLVAAPMAIPFMLAPAANAALFGAMLRQTPEEFRGRVTNSLMQLATALATLAPLIAGLLVESVGAHWAVAAFAGVLAISTVMALSLKGLRDATQSQSATESVAS